MKYQPLNLVAAGIATLGFVVWAPVQNPQAVQDTQGTQASEQKLLLDVLPAVFQAAGPNAASIQSAVDQFRAAIGGVNNGNAPGPLPTGRREINWDGGGNNPATSPGPTPFEVFLASRGAQITTPGTGFVQATPAGLAETFNYPSLTTIFQPFSPLRLFAPAGSITTDVDLFLPGGNGIAATTSAFGVVFSDADQVNKTRIRYFDAQGNLLFSSFVAASPGTATFSFLGVQFPDARIGSVRITTGDLVLDVSRSRRGDVVAMDDFIYGEPQQLH